MLNLYCILLTLLYVFEAFRGRKDLFSPRVVFNMFAWLKNVPYFWETGGLYPDVLAEKYFIIKVLSCIFVNLGITFYEKSRQNSFRFVYTESAGTNKTKKYHSISLILFIIGFAIKVYTILDAGGLVYILSHLNNRRVLMAGLHYQELFSNTFLVCSALCAEVVVLTSNKRKGLLTFIIVSLVTFLSLAVFGARRPAIMFLLQLLICYHFVYKTIRFRSLFSLKYILATILILFFIIFVPKLRESDNSELLDSPAEWIAGAAEESNRIFQEFSYLSGDMFVLEHFSSQNYWFGRSYLNILVQWIPRSLYPKKPPMDDGMYLYNMMCGIDVHPNDPTSKLYYQTSIPFTLEGALFSNFGWLGIVLGCLLLGLFYQAIYKLVRDTNGALLSTLIYQELIFVFVPSVLHTTSMLISVLIYSLVLVPLFHIRIYKK